ncbi:MAG: hypothetical protein JO006_01015 [Paucibacter sp.]|nr:hypothetical protein [Roseateles sp.]
MQNFRHRPESLLSHEIQALQRAVLAAIRSHRPLVLRQLMQAQGAERFALSLQGQPRRVVEDALSMLPPGERCLIIEQPGHGSALVCLLSASHAH